MENFAKDIKNLSEMFSQMKIDPIVKDVRFEEESSVTEDKLIALYESMGISEGDKNIHLNVIHINGVVAMKTDDIFSYMGEYQPRYVEWISRFCCNVAFRNANEAAQAIIGLSRPILKNDKIENRFSKEERFKDQSDLQKKSWRLDTTHPLSKSLILRFATKNDHKRQADGKRSRFYKKRDTQGTKSIARPTQYFYGKRKKTEDEMPEKASKMTKYSVIGKQSFFYESPNSDPAVKTSKWVKEE